jgi:hypothetical protein
MKTWAYAASAVAALGALALVTMALRRPSGEGGQIPKLISDCQQRVDRIERELQRIKAVTAA